MPYLSSSAKWSYNAAGSSCAHHHVQNVFAVRWLAPNTHHKAYCTSNDLLYQLQQEEDSLHRGTVSKVVRYSPTPNDVAVDWRHKLSLLLGLKVIRVVLRAHLRHRMLVVAHRSLGSVADERGGVGKL